MRPVNYNDRVLAVGKTRSGKTTLIRRLFASMHGARRVAIDPKAQLELGIERTRSPAAIDGAAPLIHYVPSALDHAEYEELYRVLWELGGPMVVWLDEAVGPTEKNWSPHYMRLIVQQGAAHGIGHYACSQRPVNIAPELRSEAEHVFVFVPATTRLDLDTLGADIGINGGELGEQLRELGAATGPHSFLWYCREADAHELVPYAPIPWEAGPIAVAELEADAEPEPGEDPGDQAEPPGPEPEPAGDQPGAG